MRAQIRRLTETEYDELPSLFQSEQNDKNTFFWQDRSPNFFSPYELLCKSSYRYWGAFVGDKLVGISGLVPIELQNNRGFKDSFIDTDLFVHPEFRQNEIGRNLILTRFLDIRERMLNGESLLTFGIEQNSQQLNSFTAHGASMGIQFQFPCTTNLEQVFLTTFANLPAPKFSQVNCQNLADMSLQMREQWIRLYSDGNFLKPKFGLSHFENLIRVDPDALAFWFGDSAKIQNGFILTFNGRGRRFRLTGKNSLILERLRQNFATAFNKGDEIKFAVTGFKIGNGPWENLLRNAAVKARELQFHCISARDFPSNEIANISNDQISFKRRIFLTFANSHPTAKSILDEINANSFLTESEPLYL